MGLFSSSSSPSRPVQSAQSAQSTSSFSRSSVPSQSFQHSSARSVIGGKPRDLRDLIPGSIYIILFARGKRDGTFHWGLYLHYSEKEGGHKLHITNRAGGWATDHAITRGVFKSTFLIGLVRVGQVGWKEANHALEIMKKDDEKLKDIAGITCRIWVGRACERLRNQGLLRYRDWPTLQNELFAFGRFYEPDTEQNYQPRPLVDSRVCEV